MALELHKVGPADGQTMGDKMQLHAVQQVRSTLGSWGRMEKRAGNARTMYDLLVNGMLR